MFTDKYDWLSDPTNEYRCEDCPLNRTSNGPYPTIRKMGYWEPCGYQICQVAINQKDEG